MHPRVDKMKMPKAKDEKQGMLNAEKLLAYVPGDVQRMVAFYRAAEAGRFTATAQWFDTILRKALRDLRPSGN